MKHFSKGILAILLMVIMTINTAEAKVTLPSFFTDNMVLQQKTTTSIWGKSDASTVKVITSWDNKTYTGKAGRDGSWKISIKTPAYGGPYSITVDDGDKLQLTNILIGEVWLCSGQSNMEMPVDGWGRVLNYEQEIANANYPEIRLLQAEHVDSTIPLYDLKVQHGGWQVCSPETVADFSSTAYFFARKVYQEKHIPIGLIHSSWSGTIIEAWTSAEALRTIHDFDAALDNMKPDTDKEALLEKYEADMKAWHKVVDTNDKGMKEKWSAAGFNDADWATMPVPSFWENKGLTDFDGVVWFRKTITLNDDFSGSDVQFEYLADDDDMLWVNGTYVDGTVGYNIPRKYTIPAALLKKGNNVLTIRIFDGVGGGGLYGPADISLKANNKIISLAGEWKYAVGVSRVDLPALPAMPDGPNRPTVLFNAMIHPIINFPIGGVIWYQGESNDSRAHQYQTLFPLMINDWRKQFKNKDLPFYFVQLAGYKQPKTQPAPSAWAELREAQLMTLKLPNTGMAVATDIGEAEDIHPKNKQEVGYRLALAALAKTYGVPVPFSGPMYSSYSVVGNNIIIRFSENNGIASKEGALKGFTIAGPDKVFYPAEAQIVRGMVDLYSPKVPNPVAVRYNWADNPDGNLTNASGLPASPFRTDNWPGITFGKK